MSFVLLSKGPHDGSGFALSHDGSWPPTLLGSDSENPLEDLVCCCVCLLPVEWRIIETSYPQLFIQGPVVIRSGEEPAPPDGTGDPSYYFYGMGQGFCCFTPPYELYPGYMELQVRCEQPITGKDYGWRTLDSWVTQYGEPVHCFACDGYDEPCCPSGTGKIYPPQPPCCTTTTIPPSTTSTTCDPSGTTTCPPEPPPPDCPSGCFPRAILGTFSVPPGICDDTSGGRYTCILNWYCYCPPTQPPPGPPPGPPPPPPPPPPPGTTPPPTTTTTTLPPPPTTTTTTTKPPVPGYPLSIGDAISNMDLSDLDFEDD